MTQQPEGERQAPTQTEAALRVADRMAQVVQQMTSTAQANAAFGEPRTVGDRTVIPAAEVMFGVGLGMGSGEGPAGGGQQTGAGFGGGAGGAARSRPIAVIVVEPQGVFVRPVVDVTQIGMAALAAGVFSLLWTGRLRRKVQEAEISPAPPSLRSVARLLRGR